MWRFCVLAISVAVIRSQIQSCHDDPEFEPDEGVLRDLQYTWLGVLQYIHIKNGTPHYFRAPRVVLISEQFVLCTAADAAMVPGGYALGNVVFTDYERDDEECGISIQDVPDAECDISILLMPIADVLLHPEFKHFGIVHSVALLKLLKPIKSYYMLAVCLPYIDFIEARNKNETKVKETLYHIDFVSDVPRDYVEEEKYVTILTLPRQDTCFPDKENASQTLICSSECGLNSGAPTIVHERTGHWTLVALATGGQPCADPLRNDPPPPAPRHILVYPYIHWISTTLTGKARRAYTRDDPFGPGVMMGTGARVGTTTSWLGHWFLSDNRCLDRGSSDDIFKFYHEVFELKPSRRSNLTYVLRIDGHRNHIIVCVKVAVPYRLTTPKIWPAGESYVVVEIRLVTHRTVYRIQVAAWAKNRTVMDEASMEYYG